MSLVTDIDCINGKSVFGTLAMVSLAVVISLSLERGSDEAAVLIGCIVMTGFGGIIQG